MRGMCCSNSEKLLADFVQYLEERNLSICNFTKNGGIFWPVDHQKVVMESFVKWQMQRSKK